MNFSTHSSFHDFIGLTYTSENFNSNLKKLVDHEEFYNKVKKGKFNKVVSSIARNSNGPFIESGYRIVVKEDGDTNGLSHKLSQCFGGKVNCGSSICPKCYFINSKSKIKLPRYPTTKDIPLVTVCMAEHLMNENEFKLHDPQLLKDEMEKHLVSSKFKGKVYGQLSFFYIQEYEYWLPVMKLICFDRTQLRALNRSLLGEDDSVKTRTKGPMSVSNISINTDTFQFEDCTYSLIEKVYEANSHRYKRSRLDAKELRVALTVYDRVGFEGIRFTYDSQR